jgi:hypothetical protein
MVALPPELKNALCKMLRADRADQPELINISQQFQQISSQDIVDKSKLVQQNNKGRIPPQAH